MMTSVKYADIVHKTSLFFYLQQGVLQVVDRANYSLRLEVKAHEDPGLLLLLSSSFAGFCFQDPNICTQWLSD